MRPWAAHRWLAAALGALAMALAGAQAPASPTQPVQPTPPGPRPVLVYVGPQGLGLESVTLADVQARWGPPEEVRRFPIDRVTGGGGHLHWLYPSQGLRFEVKAKDASDRNPRVGHLGLVPPFAGQTAQGLYLGMPQAEAEAILQRLYKVRYRHTVLWAGGMRPEDRGKSVGASNLGWRRSQSLGFTFRNGRLEEMSFQLQPEPWVDPRFWRETMAFGVLMALALAGTWLVRTLRRGMGVWWGRAQALLGLGLLVGAALAVFLAFGLFRGGDGYGRLVGLVLGVGGLGAAAVGAGLLFTAARTRD